MTKIHDTRHCFCCTQMRLYMPEVGNVQRTPCNEALLTPPDVCPSTATTMLSSKDNTLDVAKNSGYKVPYASEEDWALDADEITVIND